MEIEQIRREAKRLRRGLELYSAVAKADSRFSRFPNQCCDSTTSICQLYFDCWGLDDFWKVSAAVTSEQNHVWLEIGSIIVDITADQFEQFGQANVIVEADSPWHRGLRLNHREFYTPEWRERIYAHYREVLEHALELADG